MEIILIVLSGVNIIIVPLLIWYLNSKNNKKIEELKQNHELKLITYKKLFNIFNSILSEPNPICWDTKNRIDLVVDLLKYAPDDIVDKFADFWSTAKKGNLEKVNLTPLYEDILLLIRKDLGYKSTRIQKKQVIELLISDE